MKNKVVILVSIISICLVFAMFYINYYINDVYFLNFEDYEEVEVFKDYKNKEYKACYGNKYKCKNVSSKIKGTVNTKKIGEYNITYVIKYKDKKLSKTKKVNVVDKISPTLDINGEFNNVCPNLKIKNVTMNAEDNYDGNLTDKIEYKIENNKIIYKVSDTSNNETKKEFDITIKDDENPNLILNNDATIYLVVGSKYVEPGYTAIDNCDDDITKKVKVSGTVDTNKAGSYELIYSVQDEYGNKATKKRTIKVFPKNDYKSSKANYKTIYLTFDDGPGSYTEKLLNILAKYNAKVTFFVTGYNSKYDYLMTRQYNEGHTVALHSYTHKYEKIYSSIDAYMEDLLKIQDKVRQYTGHNSMIIRFPGGSSNTVSRKYRAGIMSDLTKKVEELGFKYYDWSISSGDAGGTTNSNKIIQNVISSISETGDNVVLLHDIKSYTVDAIEGIIQYGLANGYTFAPLTMESPVAHQKVNN